MKNLTLAIAVIFCFATLANGQSRKTQALLDSIQGQYQVDDNQNLTYSRVVECPGMTKKQIYDRAQAWFVYNYNSGKAVVQVQDSTTGTIIGKGYYDNVHTGMILLTTLECDAWHIVRIDAKDGKYRVILTLTEWDRVNHGSNGSIAWPNSRVSNGNNAASRTSYGLSNILASISYNLEWKPKTNTQGIKPFTTN